jgi:putative spermidine/putrescine transport system permease protein
MKKRILFAYLLICFLGPPSLLIYLSFSTDWYFPTLFGHPFTLENWELLFTGSSQLLNSGFLSLMLSLSVSAIATTAGFFASRAISYYTQSHWWLVSAFFPYVIAPVVFAVMLNYYFLQLNLSGTLGGVLLAQLFITFPYATIFFHGFWNQHIQNLEGLVATMGGNFFTILKHALFPSARGLYIICFFQCFLISWFEYGLTQYIGVGKIQTLTVLVYRYVGEANPYLAALAGVLLILPPLFLLFFNRKYLLQNVWSLQA